MKLICKKSGPTKDRLNLTIDKEYEVIKTRYCRFDNSKAQSYRVVNDDGKECYYDASMFMSKEEIREIVLKKILGE